MMSCRGVFLAACGLLLLAAVAHGAESEALRRSRHRRSRARRQHRHAAPPPTEAQEEQDLQNAYDQAQQEDSLVATAVAATGGSLSETATAAAAAPTGDLHTALRDLADVHGSIKGQFNNFFARVEDDTNKLQEEVKKKDAEIEDLEAKASQLKLRVETAEGVKAANQRKAQHDLQTKEARYEKQLKELQTQDEQLTQTNLKLVGTNDDLTKDLKEEKERNQRLVAKLQRLAGQFAKQQQAVSQMVATGAQKVALEVEQEEATNAAQDAEVNEEAQSGSVVVSYDDGRNGDQAEEEQATGTEEEQEDEEGPASEQDEPAQQEPPRGREVAEVDREMAEDAGMPAAPPPAPRTTATAQSRGVRRVIAARKRAVHKARSLAAASAANSAQPAPQQQQQQPTGKATAALPPLPVAPPKEDAAAVPPPQKQAASDDQLDKLRAEVDALSSKKVAAISTNQKGAVQQKAEEEPGLAALQDVGNMLKDVEGM